MISVVIQAIFENKRAISFFTLGVLLKIILQLPMLYLFHVYGSFISTSLGLVLMIALFYRRIASVLVIDRKALFSDVKTISWISMIMGLVVLLAERLLGSVIPVTGYVSSFWHLLLAGGSGLLTFVLLTLKTGQLDRLIGSKAQVLRKKLRMG